MREHPVSEYAQVLRQSLPTGVFTRAPHRILFLFLHLGIIAGSLLAIGCHWGGWPARIALSLLLGHSFAGAAFVAHETLHGSVVAGRRARWTLGALAFLPFAISPTLWIAWHNRVHHGHTGHSGVDPDTYPTLARYRESRAIRIVDRLSLGGRRLAGLLTLLLGFTGQSLLALRESAAFGLARARRRAAILYTVFAWALWLGIGYFLGPIGFVFGFVVPLLVGNAIVMAYILTNHSLMPLTEVNDPLLNSLSVTTPRLFEALHLNFGFHVEHHLFPAMSPRHARLIRRLILERWPDRYQSLPLGLALRLLWATPRIYENDTTLVHPRNGERHRTLLPRERDAADDSFGLTSAGARLSLDRNLSR